MEMTLGRGNHGVSPGPSVRFADGSPTRMVIVFNPVAGRRRAHLLWRVLDVLVANGVRLDLAETHRAGHAEALAREAARRGEQMVVAAGGDGTIAEVANGLDGLRRPAWRYPTRHRECPGARAWSAVRPQIGRRGAGVWPHVHAVARTGKWHRSNAAVRADARCRLRCARGPQPAVSFKKSCSGRARM